MLSPIQLIEIYGIEHISIPKIDKSNIDITLEEYKQFIKSKYTFDQLIEKLYYQKGGSKFGT